MRIFWKRAVKIAAASGADPHWAPAAGGSAPSRPLPPADPCPQQTPATALNRVAYVSSAKRVLLRWEKNKFNISRGSSFALAPIFH